MSYESAVLLFNKYIFIGIRPVRSQWEQNEVSYIKDHSQSFPEWMKKTQVRGVWILCVLLYLRKSRENAKWYESSSESHCGSGLEANLHISALISWFKPPQLWKKLSTCRLCGNRIIRYPKYDFEQQNEEFLKTFLLAMAKEMQVCLFVFK